MINWQLPIRRERDKAPARWIGTIKRHDGLNFVVATMTTGGDEEVGCYTVEGRKKDSGKWNLENVR